MVVSSPASSCTNELLNLSSAATVRSQECMTERTARQADDLNSASALWVKRIGAEIGERNLRNEHTRRNLRETGELIRAQLEGWGWTCQRQAYQVEEHTVENLAFELPDRPSAAATLVIGAHYDTVATSPGANDNGSGLACLLRAGELLSLDPPQASIRLVAFTNEEWPHTRKPTMGSLVYARACAERHERLRGMLSLETLCTTRHPWSRRMPLFLVSNLRSRGFGRAIYEALRPNVPRTLLHVTAPGSLPLVKSSDHWSFWKCGYPAVMLTAGGPLTYRHYHRNTDKLENVDLAGLDELARAVATFLRTLSG